MRVEGHHEAAQRGHRKDPERLDKINQTPLEEINPPFVFCLGESLYLC